MLTRICLVSMLLFSLSGQAQDIARLKKLIKAQDSAAIESLIKGGLDINGAYFADGNTLLHQSIAAGREKLASFLVRKGADVNKKNTRTLTPLYMAVDYHYFGLAELLLQKGADVNAIGEHGSTCLRPLLYHARDHANKKWNQENLDMLAKLVEHGIDLNYKCLECKNITYLMTAVMWATPDMVQALLDDHVNVNDTDADGHNALHFAVKQKNADMVTLLIDAGINKEQKDREGKIPLDYVDKKDHALADLLN